MTARKSRQFLAQLLEGPKTRAELAELTGIEWESTRGVVSELKRNGLAVSDSLKPVRYAITKKGQYLIDPKSDPNAAKRAEARRLKKLATNQKYRDAKRLASGVVKRVKVVREKPAPPADDFPIERRIVPAPSRDSGLVFEAIKSRRALEQAWTWN